MPVLLNRVTRNSVRLLKRAVRSTTPWVMLVTGIGMLSSLVVDVLIAARLGTSAAADALIIALTLPQIVDMIVREGTRFSLLSFFVELRHRLSEEEYRFTFSGFLNLFLIIGLACTLTGWLLAPSVISLLGPGLALESKTQATQLFRLSIALTVFTLGSSVLGVQLNSQRHFVLASTRIAIVSSTVALAIGWAWKKSQVALWIAGAYTLGHALVFGVFLWYSVWKTGLGFNWRAWPSRSALRQLGQATAYPVAGFGARQALQVFLRALASLISSGGVSAYYFAFRLISAVQSLIGVSVAIIGLPGITEHDLRKENKKLGAALRHQLERVIWMSLPVAVGTILFDDQIVQLLYGRGVFDETAITLTGQILQWLGVGVVFLCIIPVLYSVLYAQRRYSAALFNMVFTSFMNALLAWGMSRLWGLIGLAVAFSASVAVSVASLYILVWRGKRSSLCTNVGKVGSNGREVT